MEDPPGINVLAVVSLLLGFVATSLLLYRVFGPLPLSTGCLVPPAIGPIAVATGALVVKGSQKGSKSGWAWVEIVFAWTGIILGVIPPLFVFVIWIGCILQGGCL